MKWACLLYLDVNLRKALGLLPQQRSCSRWERLACRKIAQEAFKYSLQAANMGHTGAMKKVGHCYLYKG